MAQDIRIIPLSSELSFTSSLDHFETITQEPSGLLILAGSGSLNRTDIFAIDGNNGRLFTVSDDFSDSLWSVNTISGLPVIEAFADNTVKIGSFNNEAIVVSGNHTTLQNTVVNGSLISSGDITANSFIKSGGTSSQFLKADGTVDSTTYLQSGSYDNYHHWNLKTNGIPRSQITGSGQVDFNDIDGNPIGISYGAGGVVNITHDSVTRTNPTTNASPTHGGTFTVIDSITSSTEGHITAVNTKTVTLPSDNNTNKLTTFTLSADSGTNQTIKHNDTLKIAGSAPISTVVSATDIVTISHDSVTRSNPTTSMTSSHGGSFTVIDSITSSTQGHITAVNTKTVTLPSAGYSHTHGYIMATDDRDIKPSVISPNRTLRSYFTSLGGMTGTADSNYQDLLVLDSYTDVSGGDMNALAFDKSEKVIRYYQADQDDTTWGAPVILADRTWTGNNYVTRGTNQTITGTKTISSVLTISNTTESTTTSTGALKVAGGVGITKNLNIGGNTIIGGNLTVNGTTITMNSETVTLDDPIITLGGDVAPTADDNKDRGVEYRWHNGTVAKKGFFGYDDSISRFTFIQDATNASEVFSGTAGNVKFGDVLATSAVFDGTFDVGTLTSGTRTFSVKSSDSGESIIQAIGNSQGTGIVFVGQSTTYGGGMVYNGDGTPSFGDIVSDQVTLFRRNNGVNTKVMSFPHSSNDVTFTGKVTATSFSGPASSVAHSVTFNDSGTGSSSPISFNGSVSRTISYNSIGAAKASDVPTQIFNKVSTTTGKSASGTTITADSKTDTLYFQAGTGMAISVDDDQDTVIITNSNRGSSQNIFKNFAVAGQSTVVADNNNDTLTLVQAGNITITTNSSTDTITISGTDTNTNTATAVDNILDGSNSGTAITYKPYTSKAAGKLYTGTTTPTSSNRLNYDGYLYSSRFYGPLTGTATSATSASHAETADWADQVDVNVNASLTSDYDLTWSSGDIIYSSPKFYINQLQSTLTSPTFVGALTGTASNATSASHAETADWADKVDVNPNNSSDGLYEIVWASGDTVYSTDDIKIHPPTRQLEAPILKTKKMVLANTSNVEKASIVYNETELSIDFIIN